MSFRRRLWIVTVCVGLIVIAALGLVQHRVALERSREAMLKNQLFRMRDAIDQYHRDQGQYPPSLSALVTRRYLRAVPKDPFTESSETWRLIPAKDPPVPGIMDIKSGAQRRASDGTALSEW